MKKQWVYKELDENLVSQLAAKMNTSKTFAQLMAQRDIHCLASATAYFNPKIEALHDPFLMQDMEKAVLRLSNAIKKGENILVYGDYDVDGTTSVAMMVEFISTYSENVSFYIPDRYDEGYGVSQKGIETAINSNVDLIITLDCGITAHDMVELANKNQMDIILCDHHEPMDTLPSALAVLDPKRKDCKYPYKELSGCGVGFKLIQAFVQTYAPNQIEILGNYLDLVSVSIGADMVPLTGENRILAFYGLKKLNQNPRPGLKALLKIRKKSNDINMGDIGFHIGPRINAAGRMDQGNKAVQLLISTDILEIEDIAHDIENDNDARKSIQNTTLEEAIEQYESIPNFEELNTIFVYNEHWNKGVIGIVASGLVERFYKPCIILTKSNNKWCGSARSVSDFNLYNALADCESTLIQFGGHAHAAGMTLEESNLEKFKTLFEKVVSDKITPDQKIPKVRVDCPIEINEIDSKLIHFINRLGPFGPSNPKPVFYFKEKALICESKVLKDLHLKGILANENNVSNKIPFIAFNMADAFELKNNKKVNCAFTIEENHWNGKVTNQLMIKDFDV